MVQNRADLDEIFDVRFVIRKRGSLSFRIQVHGRSSHVSSHRIHDDIHAFQIINRPGEWELSSTGEIVDRGRSMHCRSRRRRRSCNGVCRVVGPICSGVLYSQHNQRSTTCPGSCLTLVSFG
eukprot:763625-Hanusia_phi.AAC.4